MVFRALAFRGDVIENVDICFDIVANYGVNEVGVFSRVFC